MDIHAEQQEGEEMAALTVDEVQVGGAWCLVVGRAWRGSRMAGHDSACRRAGARAGCFYRSTLPRLMLVRSEAEKHHGGVTTSGAPFPLCTAGHPRWGGVKHNGAHGQGLGGLACLCVCARASVPAS